MSTNRRKIADRIGELSQPTGTETHLNVAFPRVSIDPKQAVAAVAVIVVGLCFIFLHGWAEEADEFTPIPAVETSAPPSEVVVSVVGAVDRPGLITLPEGARVADALAQAGPQPEANLVAVNQAQKLVDGTQITVPVQGAVGAVGAAEPGGGAGGVSLNSATAAQLQELDGVGEKTAAAIIAYREQNGGFSSLEQLQDVKGIGPATFDKLKDKVTL